MIKSISAAMISMLTLNFSCQCSSSNTGSNSQEQEVINSNSPKIMYSSSILIINSKAKNLDTWDGLFNIGEFVTLYENSIFYIDSAILFLRDTNFTDRQKKICIATMQRVSLEHYIKICYECKSLFDKEVINEELLEWSIVPNFSNRYLILRNYKSPLVSEFLKSLKENSRVTGDFKERMDEILIGKTWVKGSSGEKE